MSYCPNCGNEMIDSSKFCGECGVSVENGAERNTPSNGQLVSSDAGTRTDSEAVVGEAKPASQSETGFLDKIASAASWFAVSVMVLLASATITESVTGMSVRTALRTTVYVALAIFAVPGTRDYLRKEYGFTFSRGLVVVSVIMGPILNEAFITPPLA
jgi:hypothetical protein